VDFTSEHHWVWVDLRQAGACISCLCHALPCWIFLGVCIVYFDSFTQAKCYRGTLRCVIIRWIYASTLAYIVDANVGRSSTAAATNSACRGTGAFVAAEIAVPLQVRLPTPRWSLFSSGFLQDAIGDGGLYTIWAGLMVVTALLILLVLYKGEKWRENGEAKNAQMAGK
jgi:hypothetical protein